MLTVPAEQLTSIHGDAVSWLVHTDRRRRFLVAAVAGTVELLGGLQGAIFKATLASLANLCLLRSPKISQSCFRVG